jgi:hypothetical protein
MAKPVDLARLAELLPGYRFAYLVTVGDDYRVRTTAITPAFDGARVDIGPVGNHGRENLSARDAVTLVWPAREVDEDSLIVDGQAELPDDPAGPVLVTPTKALLHRPVLEADSRRAVGTVHDCVQLKADSAGPHGFQRGFRAARRETGGPRLCLPDHRRRRESAASGAGDAEARG